MFSFILYHVQDSPEMAGFVIFQERPLDGSDTNGPVISENYMYSHVLYILNIAVSEAYQNSGVGSLLLKKSLSICQEDDLCAGVRAEYEIDSFIYRCIYMFYPQILEEYAFMRRMGFIEFKE